MSTPDWSTFGETADGHDELDRVKRERDKLARELYEVKHRHADYIEAFTAAVEEAVGRIEVAPVPSSSGLFDDPEPAAPGSEYAVALLSDLQTGKITPDYDSEVCRHRVLKYADKVIELAQIQEAHHPVRHCVVAMLGDMLEGVDIFPGQQWLIDSTLYEQLLNTTPTIIVDFVRRLLTYFDTVTAYAVDGNHGRIGRKGQYGPEDNADRMVYRIVELMLRDEPRFELHMRDPRGERNWYLKMDLGAYSALLIHGDQIRGHSGFPWYGLGKKVQGWGSGALGADSGFLDVFMGHWHQRASIPLNHRTVWVNGSTESTNTYAAESLAAQSEPSQWLLFVDPEKGRVTASYGVDLR